MHFFSICFGDVFQHFGHSWRYPGISSVSQYSAMYLHRNMMSNDFPDRKRRDKAFRHIDWGPHPCHTLSHPCHTPVTPLPHPCHTRGHLGPKDVSLAENGWFWSSLSNSNVEKHSFRPFRHFPMPKRHQPTGEYRNCMENRAFLPKMQNFSKSCHLPLDPQRKP